MKKPQVPPDRGPIPLSKFVAADLESLGVLGSVIPLEFGDVPSGIFSEPMRFIQLSPVDGFTIPLG